MRFVRELSCLAIAAAFAGCADRAGGEAVVARSTVVASHPPARATGKSVEERFGLQPREPSSDGGASEASGMMRWDVPAGWVERAPSSMRLADFLVAGDADAQCYLTILAGDAGGVGANVNRWLGQMGQPALGPAQIEALPRARMFERDAVLLEAEGSFTGMSGGPPAPGRRLLGLLLVDPAGSAFLKLVGPSALVERERASFLALAASFRSARTGEPAPSDSTARVERAAGLVARVPSDWIRTPEKPPRAIDLRVDDRSECSITVLAGEAGGARANVDRWRAQLGLAALDDAQFAALARVDVLGSPALLAEAESAGGALIGVVASAAGRTIFVKLTGPADEVARHRAELLDLCRTLEEG